MDFSKFTSKPLSLAKLVGIALLAIIVLAFVFQLLGPAVSSVLPMRNRSMSGSAGVATGGYAPSVSSYSKDVSEGYAYDVSEPLLSARNIAPMPPMADGSTGNDAEKYEVKDYTGAIEARQIKETCARIKAWKAQSYIIFETSNESDRACSYTFKVEQARVGEVLANVKALDPKELVENGRTIKRTIDDFTSETEILQKKKATIEKTLDDAVKAYDEITTLATRTQDAASLARIIESKLQIIERLTQERITVNEQLDRLSRSKAEQLDRLEYTYFHLNVYENKFIDGEQLSDSWKEAVRTFVRNLNEIAQALTVQLVALFFFALQYVLYFFIALVIVKYVWKFAKALWKS